MAKITKKAVNLLGAEHSRLRGLYGDANLATSRALSRYQEAIEQWENDTGRLWGHPSSYRTNFSRGSKAKARKELFSDAHAHETAAQFISQYGATQGRGLALEFADQARGDKRAYWKFVAAAIKDHTGTKKNPRHRKPMVGFSHPDYGKDAWYTIIVADTKGRLSVHSIVNGKEATKLAGQRIENARTPTSGDSGVVALGPYDHLYDAQDAGTNYLKKGR